MDSQCCLLITAGQPHAPATSSHSLKISLILQGVVAVLSLTLTSDLLWLDNKLLVGCKKGEMAELTGERDPDPRKAAHANHSIFIDLCLHPEVEPGRSRRQGGAFMLLVYSS